MNETLIKLSSTGLVKGSEYTGSVLTVNIPYTVHWALPYGPAVVNGILTHHGYTTKTWDLSTELHNELSDHKDYEKLLQLVTAGYAGHFDALSKDFFKRMSKFIKHGFEQHKAEFNPDIVAFSVFSSQSADVLPIVVTIAREVFPDAYFLVGGRGLDNIEKRTGMTYGDLFYRYLPIDCAYLGDAENELHNVMNNRTQGVVYADPVNKEELLNTPAANWNGYDFSLYEGYDTGELYVPITASKGCVRQCTFCDVHASWPKYIFRDGTSIGNEMVDLYERTGMKRFEFTDNLVNGSASNWRLMNKTIAERMPNTLKYKGYAICRSKQAHPEEDFEIAKVAGADVLKIGVESGSEKIRYDIKKKFTNDDLDWFATNCYKNDINQIWLMFCGYPTETDSDFEESIRLLTEYQHMTKNNRVTVFLSLPMMLTTLGNFMQFRQDAEEYGLWHNQHDPMAVNFWTSTKYEWNTWPLRSERFKRLINHATNLGYIDNRRQGEKLKELEGLDKIYADQRHTQIALPDTHFHIG